MTITQPTTPTPASSNPLFKFFLSAFNFLIFIVGFGAFVLAAIFIPSIGLNPGRVLPFVVLLSVVALLGNTYTSLQNALETKNKAHEKIQLQQTIETQIETDDQKAADAVLPSFGTLLKRNIIVALVFSPVLVIVNFLYYGFAKSFIYLRISKLESQLEPEIVFPLFWTMMLTGWVYLFSVMWKRSTYFVDRYVLDNAIDLPEKESIRKKRLVQESLSQDRQAGILIAFGMWFAETIGRVIIYIVLFAIPVFLVLAEIQDDFLLNLNVTSLIPFIIGYLVVLIVVVPRIVARLVQKEFRIQQKSTEYYSVQQVLLLLMIFFAAVLFGGFILRFLATNLGMNSQSSRVIMILTWIVGIILFVVFGNRFLTSFSPKSQVQKLLAGYEEAIRSGDYENLISMVDALMEKLPNWETKIPAAAAYAQVARFEDAERLVRETLQELSQADNDAYREMYKSLMGQAFGLLAEIYFAQARYDEAEKYLKRALEFGDNGYPINNTAAKLNLNQGQAEAALKHIEQAAKKYGEDKQPISAYNIVLRAWASAIQGDNAQADQLMKDALERVEPNHHADLAEIYLYGGYIMRAQGNRKAEALSYQKAIELDGQGISGYVARRELEKLSQA